MRITKSGLKEMIIATLFVASLVYFTYIAIYETLYSVGIYVIFPVLGIGFIVGLISQVFKGRSLIRLVQVSMMASTILYSAFIIEHEVRRFKPTKTIQVPSEFEGTVYLFLNDQPNQDIIEVDEFGVGYLEEKGDFKVEVHHGSEDISDVTHTSNSTQIRLFGQDSLVYAIVNVWCFDVAKDREYPKSETMWQYRRCLSMERLEAMIERGEVDRSRLKFIEVAEPYKVEPDMLR